MNDPFLQLLGIAKRANRISLGFDSAKESMQKSVAKICLISRDVSQNTSKKAIKLSYENNVRILKIKYSMEEIENAAGKKTGVITINDNGFAKRFTELYQPYSGEEYLL